VSYDVIQRSRRTKGVLAQGNWEAAEAAIRRGRQSAFDLIILCAVELEDMYRTLLMVRPELVKNVHFASNVDDRLNRRQIEVAADAAKRAANAYRRGERVLVTCAEGRNRSGLVTALALHFATGCGGPAAVEIVKARRLAPTGPALSNPTFENFLRAIPPQDEGSRTYLSKVG
jgi:protein-tyrosine phosphatase